MADYKARFEKMGPELVSEDVINGEYANDPAKLAAAVEWLKRRDEEAKAKRDNKRDAIQIASIAVAALVAVGLFVAPYAFASVTSKNEAITCRIIAATEAPLSR